MAMNGSACRGLSYLAFQQNGGGLAGSHFPDEAQHLAHGRRLGNDFPVHRRHLFGDVLDGGRHAFRVAATFWEGGLTRTDLPERGFGGSASLSEGPAIRPERDRSSRQFYG
jgi:hypothetical protein